jgi:hypothetical protein
MIARAHAMIARPPPTVTPRPAALGSDSTAPRRDMAIETGQPFWMSDPRSLLGAVIALVGAGLLMQGIAYALARSGDG